MSSSIINIPISNNEVPDLREAIGWSRRDEDYPTLFERCNLVQLVQELLRESERFGLKIVSVTYEEKNTSFYSKCGFTLGSAGVWQASQS